MKLGFFVRLLLCIALVGVLLYAYISKQNSITELRLSIPILAQELECLTQENIRHHFLIDQFENPQHLMQLKREPQFSHLKFPQQHEIIIIEVP